MTKRKKKVNLERWKGFLPYLIAGVVTLALVTIGSLDKRNSEVSLSLSSFAANNYDVSTDQLSELYVVADLSDALGLASASDVASNYIITNTMYDSGQTSAGKLEKPSITNITASRGVIEYTVAEGEDVNTIASKSPNSVEKIFVQNSTTLMRIAARLNLVQTGFGASVQTIETSHLPVSCMPGVIVKMRGCLPLRS